MATGNEWTMFAAGAVAAIPVVVVLGTAAVLAVGGVIGCTKCFLAALGSARPIPEIRLSVEETESAAASRSTA